MSDATDGGTWRVYAFIASTICIVSKDTQVALVRKSTICFLCSAKQWVLNFSRLVGSFGGLFLGLVRNPFRGGVLSWSAFISCRPPAAFVDRAGEDGGVVRALVAVGAGADAAVDADRCHARAGDRELFSVPNF